MKKWIKEWQIFVEYGKYRDAIHLICQMYGGFLILLVASITTLTGSRISGFWDIILIMIVPAICGYFSSKHNVDQVINYFSKNGTNLKLKRRHT